jgi:dihydrofolate synthase/folylpolyglutamate synthase
MLDSVLRASGYKVGLYTSPYIEKFNERMAVDGEPISDEELSVITTEVREFADKMADPPTEFELITAVAFVYFSRHSCDYVVLEVGMGGRLDATNIIKTPILSVIVGISLDHTAFLGNTVAEVAREKAGIIKSGVPVLFGGNDAEAAAVIRAVAEERGSDYFEVDRTLVCNVRGDFDRNLFDFKDHKDIKLSLIGSYQPYNAANVISAVDILKDEGLSISEEARRKGLVSAKWPARFELLSKEPTVIYDGAHNPEGIEAACRSIKNYFGDKKVFVLSGVMKDKDYDYIASMLSEIATKAFTVTPDNPRALDAKDYAEVLSKKNVTALPFASLSEALKTAYNTAKNENTPLVCLGSLYMYSELIEAFEKL